MCNCSLESRQNLLVLGIVGDVAVKEDKKSNDIRDGGETHWTGLNPSSINLVWFWLPDYYNRDKGKLYNSNGTCPHDAQL